MYIYELLVLLFNKSLIKILMWKEERVSTGCAQAFHRGARVSHACTHEIIEPSARLLPSCILCVWLLRCAQSILGNEIRPSDQIIKCSSILKE